jgi:hypothetical protein
MVMSVSMKPLFPRPKCKTKQLRSRQIESRARRI